MLLGRLDRFHLGHPCVRGDDITTMAITKGQHLPTVQELFLRENRSVLPQPIIQPRSAPTGNLHTIGHQTVTYTLF